MKIGIFITTYCETDERFYIIQECINSLIDKQVNYDIIIVNDGSKNEKHVSFIKNLPNIIYIEQDNLGISAAKNTCIRFFMKNNYDFGFLVDDDLFYMGNIFDKYVEAFLKTKIHHFTLFVDPKENQKMVEINGFKLLETNYVNGCLLTITKELIEKIGGFKILPYKYGHEHSNFSIRAKNSGLNFNKWYDLFDTSYIKIHEGSHKTKSISNIDNEKFKKNEIIALNINNLYEKI